MANCEKKAKPNQFPLIFPWQRQAEERQYSLEYRIEGLHEEKRVIEQEYSKVPKAGEIEKRMKTLEKEVEEVRHDIATRLQECRWWGYCGLVEEGQRKLSKKNSWC